MGEAFTDFYAAIARSRLGNRDLDLRLGFCRVVPGQQMGMALALVVVIWIGIDLLAMNLCIRMGLVPTPGKHWTPRDERQLARWARSQRS